MDINQQFADLSKKINNFVNFVSNKLKNFPRLTLGEQISFACVGVGIVLILISFILFIV